MNGSMADLFTLAIMTTLKGALPILLAAMVVGLLVGILQTATSIQEQTLSFVPKILVVMFTAVLFGQFIFSVVGRLGRDVFGNLDAFIK